MKKFDSYHILLNNKVYSGKVISAVGRHLFYASIKDTPLKTLTKNLKVIRKVQ
ncbi:hypothetical protein [Staphylococcus equorum]|uniref:hypothetical protein n=1 Tax=Staphylococcus equorum TaxID=246432 RepID=UPI0018E148F9|nr:hypothetical protein [Staphylococcus equorum]MEB7852934.1 hypothetical protein [Staphylococcus equorum]